MRAAALVALAVAGCVTPTPPGDQPDLARRAAAPQPLAPSPPPPSLPVTAEVELSGTIARPPAQKGDVTVWITDGPCWQPGTHAFGSTRAVGGDKWFLEVFVPQGTQLWACGALGDPKRPLIYSGQAAQAPLLGKGVGEVVFTKVDIALAKGKPVTAPPPLTAPPGKTK